MDCNCDIRSFGVTCALGGESKEFIYVVKNISCVCFIMQDIFAWLCNRTFCQLFLLLWLCLVFFTSLRRKVGSNRVYVLNKNHSYYFRQRNGIIVDLQSLFSLNAINLLHFLICLFILKVALLMMTL